MGSPLYKDYIPETDSVIVSKLKEAGAIILGKTNTTVFAYLDPAPTKNPWAQDHTPGGSSSGSAAAVSAQMCPLAFGSQTAGSIIRPASFCGVVGVHSAAQLAVKQSCPRVVRAVKHMLCEGVDHQISVILFCRRLQKTEHFGSKYFSESQFPSIPIDPVLRSK